MSLVFGYNAAKEMLLLEICNFFNLSVDDRENPQYLIKKQSGNDVQEASAIPMVEGIVEEATTVLSLTDIPPSAQLGKCYALTF